MNFLKNKVLIILLTFILLFNTIFAEKTIKIAAFEQEPYIGTSLPQKGYVYELVSDIFKKLGYKVTVEFLPLARAQIMAENGELDAIMPVYYNKSKESLLAYSNPFKGNTISILKNKTFNPNIKNINTITFQSYLTSLQTYKFGVRNGFLTSTDFDNQDSLKKEYTPNDLQNILKLESKRVDLVIIDKYSAADILSKELPHLIGKFDLLERPLASNNFYLAFSKKSKDYSKKLNDFNNGLKQMMINGEYNKILEKNGMFINKNISKNKITLTIGTVDNEDMKIMEKLSKEYKKTHPNIEFQWKFLEEETLRKRLLSDMAIKDGQFDIMTIGIFEAPLWAKQNWIIPMNDIPKNYEVEDIFKVIRDELSYKGVLYALPFYGESSILYYRKDLFDKLGLKMPKNPTYDDIRKFASLLHNPSTNVYGIGLRGKPGWGANMALLNTMVNTYGGQWFDMKWQTTINTPQWEKALINYKELITKYGPPNPTNNNYNELLKLFANGNLAMWIDATVATGVIYNPKKSKVFDKTLITSAPTSLTKKGSQWLWTWNLAIPYSSKNQKEATDFILWATSKEYINLVGKTEGWMSIPQGTRVSTYKNPNYLKNASFANYVYETIQSIKSEENTLNKSPYKGILYVSIPEYPSLGLKVGTYISEMIKNKISITEVLLKSQNDVSEQMRKSGYTK